MLASHVFDLTDFLRESNRIESISGVSASDFAAAQHFLLLEEIHVVDMEDLVQGFQPGKRLRTGHGMNVVVGDHRPPEGGPDIRRQLEHLLVLAKPDMRRRAEVAYRAHHHYESLHPFMDGNGRSGRMLWLWMMGGIKRAPLGFLHHWYYQSLQFGEL